ncbi:MAG: hypothetical protein KJ069_00480 [Anaerolineae bacterium]|nr:hypothetical protein [Anaerolineae bacterium]
MSESITAVWSELVDRVALRWQLGIPDAEAQMVAVLRHAVYDPALALLISTTGLLQMSLPPDATTAVWVNQCADAGQKWLQAYRLLEHRCGQRHTAVPETCHCILSQLAPLFNNSAPLLVEGQILLAHLPPEEEDEAYEMLLRALTRLTRMSTELSQNDLSWLWDYIDAKTY